MLEMTLFKKLILILDRYGHKNGVISKSNLESVGESG